MSASAVADKEESLQSKKAVDAVCALKEEFSEHVLRLRELEGRIETVERARVELGRDHAQVKRKDVHRRTTDVAVH